MKRSNRISKLNHQAKVSQLNSKTYGSSDIFSCIRNRIVGLRLGPPGRRADGKRVCWFQGAWESTEEYALSCDGGLAKASATDDREVSTKIGIKGVGLLAFCYITNTWDDLLLKGGLGKLIGLTVLKIPICALSTLFLWVKRQHIVLGLHGGRGLATLQRGKIDR